jgi:CheY-like chemotaxis protein
MARTILLVEDNEMNREVLERRLVKRGYLVLTARNGKEAVESARNEDLDLILMDLSLPVLDGWEATAQIRALPTNSKVPIIALTAHAMSGDRQRALDVGCDEYETKPINLKNLLGKIELLCSGGESGGRD